MDRSKPVIVEQRFNNSIEEVWNAITHIDQMTQWFFENVPAFEAQVGFETSFNVHANGRDYLHLWKITEVIPKKKIVYSWKYKDYSEMVWLFSNCLRKMTKHC
jgi:uncharacterized protein YndB with AHSA1/START domain